MSFASEVLTYNSSIKFPVERINRFHNPSLGIPFNACVCLSTEMFDIVSEIIIKSDQ